MTILTPNFKDIHDNGHANAIAHMPNYAGNGASQPHPAVAPAALPLKVALIGTAPSSRMLAPYGDPAWKIWACSPGNMNTLPRVDVWFELHSNLLWPEHEAYGRPYIEWLRQQKFPVYMQDQVLVPNATVFPKDELVAEFGDDFFSSSFTWMMALAMKLGAVEIALYGIDMASRDEYIQQRPGFFFFRYLARQRGIKISAPHESDIMQSPALYGYVDSTPFGRKLMSRKQEVQGRVNGMTQQIDQATHSRTYLQGALEDIDYIQSIWSGVGNEIGKLQYENAQLKAEMAQMKAPHNLTAAWVPLANTPIAQGYAVTPPVMTAVLDPQWGTAATYNSQQDTAPTKKTRRRRVPQPVTEATAATEAHDG